MKTSNKILIGLFVVVFTIPFLLALTLRTKINNGEYVVKKFEQLPAETKREGSFSTFKVVKVVAPNPDLLQCHLKLSDKMVYQYENNNTTDSVSVSTQNDTLFIQYIAGKSTGKQRNDDSHDNLEIYVQLPTFNYIIIDGSVVIIDSLSSSLDNISVTLHHNGVIKDGTEYKERKQAKHTPVKLESNTTMSTAIHKTVPAVNSVKEKYRADEMITSNFPDIDIRSFIFKSIFYRLSL